MLSVRADRLVAILLLLQTRGQVTAGEVAEELEVSERTARRDLEALGIAGLPIYSIQGRSGGWRLAGGGKTDLSGLTEAEARALFLVAGPATTSPEVKAALRKLVRALPEPFRDDAQAASSAIVVDPDTWDRKRTGPPPPPLLDDVQAAVVKGQQLRLVYIARDRSETTRVIHPLGLASKGPVWYLVAGTSAGQRTFRVDRMQSIEVTGEPVEWPADFDLEEAWRAITGEIDLLRTPVSMRALSHPDSVWRCRMTWGTRLQIGVPEADGRVPVEIRGHSHESLAAEVAGMGPGVEVVHPPEVRELLAGIGRGLVDAYGTT